MAKNTSVTLTPHFEGFIAEQIAAGHYASASEVVRAGLRLIEERERRLQSLRDAIIEGEESGIAKDFDFDRFIDEIDAMPEAKRAA
jgi:antitoxin ParD1/3/4